MRNPWAATHLDSSLSRPTVRIATTDGVDDTLHARDVPGWRYQFPAWSPDGTKVAAIRESGAFVTVDVFDADPAAGGQPTTIYKSDQRPAFYLFWAPDSRHVSFLTSEPNPDDIALRIAPVDASAPAEVVPGGSPVLLGLRQFLRTHAPHGEHRLEGIPR